jgi:hypothetical protein
MVSSKSFLSGAIMKILKRLSHYSVLSSLLLAAASSFLPAQSALARNYSDKDEEDAKVQSHFSAARTRVVSAFEKIDLAAVDQLAIPQIYKDWLKTSDHLVKLQFYVGAMKLYFQEAPCLDGGQPRGTCFDNSDPDQPKMLISYSYNQETRGSRAEALIIHEAGHFTGEMNHVLLSGLGQALSAHPLVKPTGLVWFDTKNGGSIVNNPDGTITVMRPVYWDAGGTRWLPIYSEIFPERDPYLEIHPHLGVCQHLGKSEYHSADVGPKGNEYRGACKKTTVAQLDPQGALITFNKNCHFLRSITCGDKSE